MRIRFSVGMRAILAAFTPMNEIGAIFQNRRA